MTSNKIRLNKYLAECGIDSRRKVEELISQGRVIVNGEVINDFSFKVDAAEDKVLLDGEPIRLQKKVYYLLNKPKGYVTTTSDEKNRKTVMELVRSDLKIFPVGRLDFNTTGLLLLTNDGDFTNLLLHPNNKVPRIYRVALDKMLDEKDRLVLIKGIMLEGKKGRFEDVRYKDLKMKKQVTIKTVEGRNHFVKNMFKVLGYKVTSLSRIKFAGLSLGDLPIGAYRELTKDEIKGILKKNV
ncbi:MAG: rRNA pseudouridine synthase [Ignavibacteriales bacterium]|nr:MAG: rRNA pseudouridine synthase [Ignavibacteriales bacterium]